MSKGYWPMNNTGISHFVLGLRQSSELLHLCAPFRGDLFVSFILLSVPMHGNSCKDSALVCCRPPAGAYQVDVYLQHSRIIRLVGVKF